MKQGLDLHVHLDGSLTVDMARKLALICNVELPEDDDELLRQLMMPSDCNSLDAFLKCFDLPLSLLQTYDSIKEAAYLVLEEEARHGAAYVELRFAPQFHLQRGLTQDEVVRAALEGMKQASIPSNLILCLMRMDNNFEANRETLEVARKYFAGDTGVVAIDLAGAEAGNPPENYGDLFAMATEYGIPFTIHAGEAAGADSVRGAINLGALRIGHGVRSFEDPELVEIIKNRGIVLEMCPTSNRRLGTVTDMKDYPFMDFLHQGIKVTINTDDPGIIGTDLSKEFEYMKDTFGMTDEEIRIVVSNSIDAAFASDEIKEKLRSRLL